MTNDVDAPAPSLTKHRDQMFTVLVVDPVAVPLARWLATRPGVTPNRVTVVAILLGLASATMFAIGELRWAGALFLVRFGVDCLDGKVARAQRRSSTRGAALDLVADVVGILFAAGALAATVVARGDLPGWVGLVLVGLIGLYAWALQYRKQLAGAHGLGDGGAHGRMPRPVAGCPGLTPVDWPGSTAVGPSPSRRSVGAGRA